MKAVLKRYEPGARTQGDGASTASNALPSSSVPPARPEVDSGNYRGGGASASNAVPSSSGPMNIVSHRGHGVLHMQRVWHLEGATRGQRRMIRDARRRGWSVFAVDVEQVTEEIATEMQIDSQEAPQEVAPIDMPVTGKPRLEFRWKSLSKEWQDAFVEPLKKAIDVYVDNEALEPVPLGKPVDPQKILPSRFVLTNKSDLKGLEEATLKARWVLAGHLDKEAGQYATEAPTASLVAHNAVCFISAQMGWSMKCADISAAFLQGERLQEERVVYIKLPKGYPDAIRERSDLVKLTKGGFGLAESPRLWYLRLRRGLLEIGLKELKLSPGTFVLHVRGHLRGILSIHVDDLRMAFRPEFQQVLDKLRQTFQFGEWQSATEMTVKFCGRWERQCPLTFQITVTMDGYTHKLKEAPLRDGQDRSPLSDAEKKWVASVGGQLNWMARQGRADLAYGISRVQQMAGARDPDPIKLLNQLVKKAREPYIAR